MHKLLHALVIAACTGFLVYQAYLNIATYLKHETVTRKFQKDLTHNDFPSIEICLNPGYNTKVLESYGYKSLTDFVKGQSNGSLIGWAGNGINGTTTELLTEAYLWKNLSDVFEFSGVSIGDIDSWDQDKVFVEVGAQHPYGKCFALNISNIFLKLGNDPSLNFKFRDMPTSKVSLFITDPNRMSWKRDLFSYTGVQIESELDPSFPKYYNHYELQITETIDSKKDIEANCMDYSSSTYGHYRKCALEEIQNYFMSHITCIPPWFVKKNNPNFCQNKLSQNLTTEPLGVWHFIDKKTVKVHATISVSIY